MVDDDSGPTLVALGDATRGAIEQLITSRIEAAFNNLQLPTRLDPRGVSMIVATRTRQSLRQTRKRAVLPPALTPTPLATEKHPRTGTTIPSEPPFALPAPSGPQWIGPTV
jgi:hypothetical protein